MALTNKEIQENRRKNNKRFDAYIPNYLAIPFIEKMQNERFEV